MVNTDILKHFLVPEHTILSEDEKQKLLGDLDISDVQLPVIGAKDPVVLAINAKVDDIVKIIRIGKTQKYVFYRRVV
tara:strand:- start:606 stop:836 length:231 start_codon:yes stop_codon:yes gene_type:complete